jgi:predicted small secreted protein
MEMLMKLTFAAFAFLLAAAAAACNTVKGVGEDAQAAGQAIENSAEDAQN